MSSISSFSLDIKIVAVPEPKIFLRVLHLLPLLLLTLMELKHFQLMVEVQFSLTVILFLVINQKIYQEILVIVLFKIIAFLIA